MSGREAVFKYVKDRYKTEPAYLWPQYPGSAALRHDRNNKWYAIVMNVPKPKLNMPGAEEVDLLDVKCRPDIIQALQNKKGFLPAYHMNKTHWISLLLDGTLHLEEVYKFIDNSYKLTKRN